MSTRKQAAPEAPARLDAPELFINRELSWLAFNERVLAQAWDPEHPLLERVKFLAIVGANLDEFFMIRVAVLQKQITTDRDRISPDGLTTEQQLGLVRTRALAMLDEQARCWTTQLRPELAAAGIRILDQRDYPPGAAEYLAGYFRREIAPVLTPLAFDPGHPFPHISNLSKNLAVAVKHEGRTKFARVKLPPVVSRFVPLPLELTDGATTFAFLEDVVCTNVQHLFPGTQVRSAHVFRVIRDTDMVIQEDEADDLLETIDQGLRQLRHGALSMLQVEERTPNRVVNILIENFEIEEPVVVRTSHRMGFADWMELTNLHRPELKYANYAPRVVWGRHDLDEVFEAVRHRDYLLHHPFDSFLSIETFLRAAASDPHVVAIKMTLYRIGNDSPLPALLQAAAEAGGKQVAALVDLTGDPAQSEFDALLVAPVNLRSDVRSLIDREASHAAGGLPARIVIKVNGLTDTEIIQQLYRASQAGVEIDLLVRGICCLRPGVAGVSDRIRVRSIVGRFLEHSRIFSFENAGSPVTYLGSADLMERNMDRRVEVLFPIVGQQIEHYVRNVVIDAYTRDTARAWELQSDGTYQRGAAGDPPVDAQQALLLRHLAEPARDAP